MVNQWTKCERECMSLTCDVTVLNWLVESVLEIGCQSIDWFLVLAQVLVVDTAPAKNAKCLVAISTFKEWQ